MKICHYNENQVGAVIADRVHPLGETLIKAGHLEPGYTMLEAITVLANEPAAMKCARFSAQTGSSAPLASGKLLPPNFNPPAVLAAAANYKAPHTGTLGKKGASYPPTFCQDEL